MLNVVPFTEAKAELSAILDRVSKGEEFVITRHNQMVAKLIPVQKISLEQIKQTVEEIKKLRKGVKISLAEITAWKNEGRR